MRIETSHARWQDVTTVTVGVGVDRVDGDRDACPCHRLVALSSLCSAKSFSSTTSHQSQRLDSSHRLSASAEPHSRPSWAKLPPLQLCYFSHYVNFPLTWLDGSPITAPIQVKSPRRQDGHSVQGRIFGHGQVKWTRTRGIVCRAVSCRAATTAAARDPLFVVVAT
jgi:hypothetical protein